MHFYKHTACRELPSWGEPANWTFAALHQRIFPCLGKMPTDKRVGVVIFEI